MYRLCWGWEWCGGAKDYWLDGDYKASDSPIEFEAIEELIDHLLKPKNISKLHTKVISRRKSKQECELFVEDGEGRERWRFVGLLGGRMGHHAMDCWEACLESGDATEIKALKLEFEMKKNSDALLVDWDARLSRSNR
jgi:hypothetical protein